ncbi:MAG: 50S ribosomal protein L29 [Chloroflexota bacterium]|nr:50S ribosomal protein L29 [Chloroflexota bacterium]
MTIKTIKEIRALTTPELRRGLEESRRELFNLRLRLATKQLANHREVPQVKDKIARILTILRERELEPTG